MKQLSPWTINLALTAPHASRTLITPQPALLQVNQEAGKEALKVFQPVLPPQHQQRGRTFTSTANVYFNPEVDTLWLMDFHGQLGQIHKQHFNFLGVKRLALWEHDWAWITDSSRVRTENEHVGLRKAMYLTWFRNLEEVTLIISSEGSLRGRLSRLCIPSQKVAPVFQDNFSDPLRKISWIDLESEASGCLRAIVDYREDYRRGKYSRDCQVPPRRSLGFALRRDLRVTECFSPTYYATSSFDNPCNTVHRTWLYGLNNAWRWFEKSNISTVPNRQANPGTPDTLPNKTLLTRK